MPIKPKNKFQRGDEVTHVLSGQKMVVLKRCDYESEVYRCAYIERRIENHVVQVTYLTLDADVVLLKKAGKEKNVKQQIY